MAARVRLGAGAACVLARVVFPAMAGPLVAVSVVGGGVVAVLARCACSRLVRVRPLIRRRVLARRLGCRRRGRRGVLSKEIEAVKHGDA